MTVKRAILVGCCVAPFVAIAPLAVHFESVLRETEQTLCVHNLKLFGMALRQYAMDHNDHFPDSWAQLHPEYLGKEPRYVNEIFRCPAHHPEMELQPIDARFFENVDYVLVPGCRVDDGQDTLLAYERVDHHEGAGRAELYIDGRGGWNPSENWR